MPENLGFIGLGSMGEPIAANLLAAGYALRVYNRTAAEAVDLIGRGAKRTGSVPRLPLRRRRGHNPDLRSPRRAAPPALLSSRF